jgi:hypothetical protein
MEDKAGMTLQPLPDFFAVMRRDIVADHVNCRNRRGNLRLQRREEGDKLALAFPTMTLPVDTPSACIKGRKEVQRSIAPILMFDPVRQPRLRGFGGMEPRPRLQRGFFIKAEDDFLRLERAGIERDEGGHLGIEGCIAGMFRRQPHMMPPRFEFMMGENAAYRRGGNGLCDSRLDESTREFGAIPLRETPAAQLRPLTGQLDQMDSDLGGKSPGGAPGELYLRGLVDPVGGSV